MRWLDSLHSGLRVSLNSYEGREGASPFPGIFRISSSIRSDRLSILSERGWGRSGYISARAPYNNTQSL